MAITGELAKVFANINKKMGADTIVLGSDIRDDILDREPQALWLLTLP